jgi:hypothetical protein
VENAVDLEHDTPSTSTARLKCGEDLRDSQNAASFTKTITIDIEYLQPNQPETHDNIPTQVLSQKGKHGKDKILSFQVSWFQKRSWLHYSPDKKGVLCFYCMTANARNAMSLSTKRDDAFCTVSFTNWKHALERFIIHELSQTHAHAVSQVQQMKSAPVNAQISGQKAAEQANTRIALLAMFSTLKFLARQGIAVRGHEGPSGNYMQLLQLRSEDKPELKSWLMRTTNFTSPESQNEMLLQLSH